MSETCLVRLKPYAPGLGYVLRSYTLVHDKIRFDGKRGWYRVSKKVAERLKDIPQEQRKPYGPKAFEIAKDSEEARSIDLRLDDELKERKKHMEVGTAEEPVEMPSRPGARQRSSAPASDESSKPSGPKPRSRTRSTVKPSESDSDDE